jgi:hypothetical protein
MKQLTLCYLIVLFAIVTSRICHATDSLSFQWPYPPFHESHYITGAFAEYRSTSAAGHFHDGVDIPIPDYQPVYASLDGVVHSIGTVADWGGGAWVRVRTETDGLWKHIAYVHIDPNPALSVGDEIVAGETILGTVIPGWGHVHFRERELVADPTASGADINALREGGGLTPFVNDSSPVIAVSTLEFRDAATSSKRSANELYGTIRILVQAHGHYGPNPINQRRGIYKLGYHIMSEDTSTYVYTPLDDGLRYQFDRKPLNSHVGRAFVQEYSTSRLHYYYLTGGDGASYINQTLTVSPNYLDTGLIPNGNYILKIFAEDTRRNADTVYVPISITRIPDAPVVRAVTVDENGAVTVSWMQSAEDYVGGYRLYYDHHAGWQMAEVETVLTVETTSYTIAEPSEYFNMNGSEELIDLRLRLKTVNDLSDPLESLPSIEFYAKSPEWSFKNPTDKYSVLIVDGIQDGDGQATWHETTHPFIVRYGSVLPFEAVVSSARESTLLDSTVVLSDYDTVIWFIGSRGFQSVSFSPEEQRYIRNYLEAGGILIVSGSAIGMNLGRPQNEDDIADSLFYADYLRAEFIAHSVAGNNPTVYGSSGSIFEEFEAHYNKTYSVSWTDDIIPVNGAEQLLHYQTQRQDGTHRGAAIGYKGPFGESVREGGVAYFAFPVETIEADAERWDLLARTFRYFDFVTTVEEHPRDSIPREITLSQNYPNPFNTVTNLNVSISERSDVKLIVHDVLGREVKSLIDGYTDSGVYTIQFDASGLASGMYFARLRAGDAVKIRSMILLK